MPRRKILLIDDKRSVGYALCSILEHLGHTAWYARNGLEALDILNKVSFDVLVTDVLTPQMDGWELVLEVHKKFPSLAVLLVRNKDTPVTDEYTTLSKPFSMVEMESAIEAAIAHSAKASST